MQTDPTAPTKARRSLDPEVQAMAKVDAILTDLPLGAVSRVLVWANARFTERALAEQEFTITDKPEPQQ